MIEKQTKIYRKHEHEIYGNLYDKYSSKNKLEKLIVKKFTDNIRNLIKPLNINNFLDIGCGEGFITNLIFESVKCTGIGCDIGESIINKAKHDYPKISFILASAYKLPFNNKSFELVTAIEILEHLESPAAALEEFKRVSKKWLVLSVPNDPLWRMLNLARFKYLTRLGNTPGHIQHWTINSFKELISSHYKVVKIINSIPWIIILCDVTKI